MFQLISLLALFGCALAGIVPSGNLGGRIVGGVETTIEEFPYQVSLKSNASGKHLCGGSILNERVIITAAHCVLGLKEKDIYIRLGSTDHTATVGGESVDVESIQMHPDYLPWTYENDVAVMKLTKPVQQTNNIKYISLAKATPENGAKAVVSGWGAECFALCPTSVNNLRKVEVDILDLNSCRSKKYSYGSKIKDSMVCAQALNKDACQGDSGGPLVSDNVLVGVVSWGRGCAQSDSPGVYADVAVLRGWIETTVAAM